MEFLIESPGRPGLPSELIGATKPNTPAIKVILPNAPTCLQAAFCIEMSSGTSSEP